MLDLTTLKNIWTVDGAREVFARLVTHSVRTLHPSAQAIRPNPGDEGIDTIVGQLNTKSRVYQSKYFPDSIGNSQKKQIRDSFKSCITSVKIKNMVLWTLCIPIEMSVDEKKWWDGWKKKQEKEHGVKIDLMTLSNFETFYSNSTLKPVFDIALKRVADFQAETDVIEHLKKSLAKPVKSLTDNDQFGDAVFVKKLEAAGVNQHRSARTAFYNFELVRQTIEQGGTSEERAELQNLLENIYSIWEKKFLKKSPNELGKDFYIEVIEELGKSYPKLSNKLGFQNLHNEGGIHYWADICEAGWTDNFKQILEELDEENK